MTGNSEENLLPHFEVSLAARFVGGLEALDPLWQEALKLKVSEVIGQMANTAELQIDLAVTEPGQELEMGQKLLMPVRELLDPAKTGIGQIFFAALCNRLKGNAADTVRAVLALGKNGALDIRHVGPKGVRVIGGALTGLALGIEWKDDPTMLDYVRLYEHPGEVPWFAVPGTPHMLHVRTVQDLLNTPLDDIAQFLANRARRQGNYEVNDEDRLAAALILENGRHFVSRFMITKRTPETR